MRMVIDKAGRMVVPKRLRDQLGLKPGTELEARAEDGELVAKPVAPEMRVVQENGRLVFTMSESVPPLTNDQVLRMIDEMREERVQHLLYGIGNDADNETTDRR